MMIEIKSIWSGEVILAVDATNLRSADLRGANLCGANLRGADLCGANLRGADLCGANLCSANLRDADLCGANLRSANLRDADLRGSDLRGSDLRSANLRDADLCGANLRDADLCSANLYDADLRGANLRGARNAPLVISGLSWVVQISGTGWMRIGCQRHSVSEWDGFDDDSITEMDASDALPFWKANKPLLMGLCAQYVHAEEKQEV